MSIAKRIIEMRRNSKSGFRSQKSEGPYDIEFSATGITNKIQLNEEALVEYNKKLKDFWADVQSELRSSADLIVRKNRYLISSIRGNRYYEDGEIYKLGFSFRPEGVYIHKGVGRGYIASGGTVVKTSNSPGFNRRPKLWFNPVIERNIPRLKEIILEYHKNLVINTTRIYIH